MPSVSLHLTLANRVLDDWRRTAGPAPFDPSEPECINAFHHGAMGPDFGFFPGGERLLSDLSHRVRSVDLARAMIDTARSPTERAFSWGWVTHLLADRAIHPLVGRGIGEVIHGDPDRFVEGQDEQPTHVRVETGFDLVYHARFGAPKVGRMRPVFDATSIRFLIGAYEATYGWEFETAPFLVSHRATNRLAPRALCLASVLSRIHLRERTPGPLVPVRSALRWAQEALGTRRGYGAVCLAFLNPIPPSPWLIQDVDHEVDQFTNRFREHFESGLADLTNFDLDTGKADVPGVPTPIAHQVLNELLETGRPTLRPNPPVSALAGTWIGEPAPARRSA